MLHLHARVVSLCCSSAASWAIRVFKGMVSMGSGFLEQGVQRAVLGVEHLGAFVDLHASGRCGAVPFQRNRLWRTPTALAQLCFV
jgi:hypothetical protein